MFTNTPADAFDLAREAAFTTLTARRGVGSFDNTAVLHNAFVAIPVGTADAQAIATQAVAAARFDYAERQAIIAAIGEEL